MLKTYAPYILAALSLIGAGFASYRHDDREIIQRVTALESHRTDDTGRLDRIENKVDQLLLFLGAK